MPQASEIMLWNWWLRLKSSKLHASVLYRHLISGTIATYLVVVVIVVVVSVVRWKQHYITAAGANAIYNCPIIQDMEGR